MRPAAAFLAVFLSSFVMAGDCATEIQIALYPYYHDAETAWRVTILPDGTARHEQSAAAVKTARVDDFENLEWIPVSQSSIPAKKLTALVRHVRDLQPQTLSGHYSAQYSFLDPFEKTVTVVVIEGKESYTIPEETTRLVTHGTTYSLRINAADLLVDSTVYAPLSALEWEDPPHPDRSEIRKIVAAWYYVLREVGPVDEFRAKDLRPYLK